MSTIDMTLGPVVWRVPDQFCPNGEFARRVYCAWHKHKLRFFFLAMVATDQSLSAPEKEWFCEWLKGVNWTKLLADFHDVASWKKNSEGKTEPIAATFRQEYDRLLHGFRRAHRLRTAEIS